MRDLTSISDKNVQATTEGSCVYLGQECPSYVEGSHVYLGQECPSYFAATCTKHMRTINITTLTCRYYSWEFLVNLFFRVTAMDRWGWVWVVLVFAPGCTGVESRLFYRDAAQPGWRQEKLRGVPVTVQVASHVKISVIDRRFFYQEDPDSMPVEVNARSRGIEYQFIHTSKLFTVDPKRRRPGPVSGLWISTGNIQSPFVTMCQISQFSRFLWPSRQSLNPVVSKILCRPSMLCLPANDQRPQRIRLRLKGIRRLIPSLRRGFLMLRNLGSRIGSRVS